MGNPLCVFLKGNEEDVLRNITDSLDEIKDDSNCCENSFVAKINCFVQNRL